MSQSDEEPKGTRREALLATSCACVLGASVLAGPAAVVLDPLLREKGGEAEGGGTHRAGSLDRFVVGGPPQKIVLRKDTQDAWLTRKNSTMGAVLVQRTGEKAFKVFSAVCPHLGCLVTPDDDGKGYNCPCHQSVFSLEGAVVKPADGRPTAAPRGLDPLPWEVRDGGLVVTWKRFKLGTAEREESG